MTKAVVSDISIHDVRLMSLSNESQEKHESQTVHPSKAISLCYASLGDPLRGTISVSLRRVIREFCCRKSKAVEQGMQPVCLRILATVFYICLLSN